MDQGLALAWGSGVELGVSGWTADHQDWGIDPEPLIVFTAFLDDADPRLRDEATDWCIRNWRHVSKTRLKNLVAEQPAEVQDAFGALSATVSTHAGVAWPNQTEARRFAVTGRSTAPRLAQPSMVWLRLRARFGLGGRAEIMRYFLTTVVVAAVVVLGAADSLESPSASSLIADYYPARTRARAYGLHRMMFFAGGAVGVLFGGLFVLFVGIGGIIFWFPTFFDRVHSTGTGRGGTYTALVGLVGIVGGAFLGGSVGDRWHGRRPGSRVALGGGGLVSGSVMLAVGLLDVPLLPRVLLLALALLLLAIAIPNLTAAIADVLPAANRGTGFALLQLFLALGSAGGPLAVGAASDGLGSLTTAFAVLVAPMVVGSFVVIRARATFEEDAAAASAR